MQGKTRIKVSRDLLVAKIKENQATAQAKHKVDVAEYDKQKKQYTKTVADFLTATVRKVKSGEVPAESLMGYRSYLEQYFPDVPSKPREPASRSLAIAQLEMSTEESIIITAEDFARYMN